MNFDTYKQQDPIAVKRPLVRNNGVAVFTLRSASDAPLEGALITLSMMQKGPGEAISYSKVSDLSGKVYFSNLKTGTYSYRVSVKGIGKNGGTRIGKLQINNFSEAEVLLTFP